MLKSPIQIQGLFTGKGKTLEDGSFSSIRKSAVNILTVHQDKIIDDEVVVTKFHGGEMRVLHHYTEENYKHLKKIFPEIADRFNAGSFGENIYTHELSEKDLCIGDIFTIGECDIQLTVPRRPCATINSSYQDKRILKEVINSGHVGWFYRVIKPGIIKTDDSLKFEERPFPNLPIRKLFDAGYGPKKYQDLDFLMTCMDTGLMDKGWLPQLDKVLKK